MAEKSPSYRWYPKDILGSLRVASMTAAEECWYRRALDFAWLNIGLPADPQKLARIIGKKCTEKGAKAVLEMFQPSSDLNIYINERQEIERQKQKEWSAKSSAGGKKSKPPGSSDSGNQSGSKGEPPLEANQEPKPNIPIAIAEEEVCIERASEWAFPMKELIEAFPNVEFTPAAAGFIEAEVKEADRIAWARTIAVYQMNFNPSLGRYMPDKTGNLLNVFRAEKAKVEKENGSDKKRSNDYQRRTDADVLDQSTDFYDQYPS
jgi:hypothetical protein